MFNAWNVRFVEMLHCYGYWNLFLGRKYDFYLKIGLAVRIVLFTTLTSAALIKIATDGVQSILNGTLIYYPLLISALVVPLILFVKRENLVRLLNEFEECWANLDDPVDRTVFEDYHRKTWKFVSIVHIGMVVQYTFYTLFPLLYDSVLHYVFDCLSEPFILLYPHMGYLSENVTWNGEYYMVVFSSVYCIFEMEWAFFGLIVVYTVIIGNCYPLFIITRKAIQDIGSSDNSHGFSEPALQKAVLSHGLLVRINQDLKAYLGLPCAFQNVFTSLLLTVFIYPAIQTDDLFIKAAFSSGIIISVLTSLLYCSLGQMLENESEVLYEELYNIPWYRFSPKVRKDIIMMMRQARKPFTIDYHGNYKMNLENFMEILRTAYSFFAIIQTLATKY